ncbi:MAG: hypothetical protein CVU60_04675 [Deltaproteobacteria bacterium HGW-Deltaproteobacteria-18]|jgi:hypothetical protein|nr:MAG: hypothetical protein CVU60_04675 [Deltaproteobacteria bacterium HGW-Deltaproteobacteria-18]
MNDDPILKTICDHLDAAVDALDEGTRRRLAEIRGTSLDVASGRGWMRMLQEFIALSGRPVRYATAGGILLALFLMFHEPPADERMAVSAPLERLELLASAQDVEFYRNLEFIAWYAQTQRGK